MRSAWQAFINLLPVWMRDSVDKLGRDTLQELRLRTGAPPELITAKGRVNLERCVSSEDLRFCINVASRYSPWTADSAVNGYITTTAGHRIGICGIAASDKCVVTGIHNVTSLCLRVSRDFPGVSADAANFEGSVLIIGCPGSGKTTLLRDLIRSRSNQERGCVAVVDERGEIFPYVQDKFCYFPGKQTDVLSGYSKAKGIEAVLRSMNPVTIAVDEITAEEDCRALLHAGWCGVKLLATAHAGDRNDLFCRPVYRPILESKLFNVLLIMSPDKTWHAERV